MNSKKLIKSIAAWALLLLALLLPSVAYSQVENTAPQQFSLQAVVRDAQGKLVPYSDLNLQVDILSGTTTGDVLYSEQQTVTTNSFGSFSTIVGAGNIDWGNGPYSMKVDISHPNGTQLTATYQLISVPYALNVHVTDSLRGVSFREKQVLSISHDTIFLTGGSFVVLNRFDGDYYSLHSRPTGNSHFANDAGYLTGEVQTITRSGQIISLTGGSSVTLPLGFDGNYNHLTNTPTALSQFTNDAGFMLVEQQVLSISHDTIFLTGGSFVKIPRRAEIQTLDSVTALGNSAGNHQLKNLADPTDPQDALTFHYLDSLLSLLHLDSLDQGSHTAITTAACDTFMWYGSPYTTSGTYLYNYANILGFFSTDTLHLTIRHGSHQSQTIASIYPYVWHGTVYNQSGHYQYSYFNDQGCPSVDTLHLNITEAPQCYSNRPAADTAVLHACGKAFWYGHYYHNSGTYQQNLGNIAANGCDSVVYVQISISTAYKRDTAARTTTGITWRGNLYTVTGDYFDTLSAVNGCDSIFVLHLSVGTQVGVGAAKGLFSVANGLQVRFSCGNLQFMSSDNYWRFAPQQYEVLNNSCAASYNTVWSDLFGWATSGYHNPADTLNSQFNPWDHNKTNLPAAVAQYNLQGYGPSTFMADTNLTGTSRYYDWGEYNIISNGGNEQDLWRVLTRDEWNYLLDGRPDGANLRGRATISGIPTLSGGTTSVSGYVFLPDDWVDLPTVNFSRSSYNYFPLSQWSQLEDAGAVFLPTGYYWSSTTSGNGAAYCFAFSSSQLMVAPYNRSIESYVRPVQDYTPGSVDCNCTYYDTTIVSSGPFSWHGRTYNETGDYIEAITNAAGCDSIISLSLIIEDPGVLPAYFSVSDTHQVRFSKGNLQYKASNNVWRFGHHQYDYRGAGNNNRSATYTGWIDLFPWATSGYHDSTDFNNIYYLPYLNNTWRDNGYGPSSRMADWDLVNTSAEYDWGVHCPIANGGNTPGQWRTLTNDEWSYLIGQRPNYSSLRGWATVNGVRGLVLLPDNWTLPAGVTFTAAGYHGNYLQNIYGVTQWAIMEAAGAVFFPTSGTSAENTYSAYYWSSTSVRTGIFQTWHYNAHYMGWGYSVQSADPGYYLGYPGIGSEAKSYILFVRLVKD